MKLGAYSSPCFIKPQTKKPLIADTVIKSLRSPKKKEVLFLLPLKQDLWGFFLWAPCWCPISEKKLLSVLLWHGGHHSPCTKSTVPCPPPYIEDREAQDNFPVMLLSPQILTAPKSITSLQCSPCRLGCQTPWPRTRWSGVTPRAGEATGGCWVNQRA